MQSIITYLMYQQPLGPRYSQNKGPTLGFPLPPPQKVLSEREQRAI